MNIEAKYLPVGTVCLLRDGVKKVMITGFCVVNPDNSQEVYDYIGCLYPEGIISSDQSLLFNHDQIIQIFFKGYVCDEEIVFKKKLNDIIEKGLSNTEAIVENQNNIDTINSDDSTEFISG